MKQKAKRGEHIFKLVEGREVSLVRISPRDAPYAGRCKTFTVYATPEWVACVVLDALRVKARERRER